MKAIKISNFDEHIFCEGNHFEINKLLGAHLDSDGVTFNVWAPNANAVSVIGDFNNWDKSVHKMEKENNIWHLHIRGLSKGQKYKFNIETKDNKNLVKSDPYAKYSELRPNTASIIWDDENYSWTDKEWEEKKLNKETKNNHLQKPMNIYEVHLGSWKKPEEKESFQTYRELADELPKYVFEMGYTHVEIMPITEYPLDASWGYQSTGYFSVTSRHGKPEDFKYLIDKFHSYGIYVILDWVPGHFCKDAHGLYRFDGTTNYEYSNHTLGENEQWGTCNFDLSKPEVHSFLISSAMYWLRDFHIDGLRVDAVSNMLYLDFCKDPSPELTNENGTNENLWAIDFMQKLNSEILKKFPNALIMAEESTSWPNITKPKEENGLGFNYKWNMGWMNDILKYIELDPIDRQYHHNLITFSLMYAFSENYILPFSHDEVVHGKKSLIDKVPGYYEDKFATLRMLMGYMMTHPGKKLLFMGGEFGQFLEWRFYESLEWNLLEQEKHHKMQKFIKDLNHLYKDESSLWELDNNSNCFKWLEADNNDTGIVTFVRKGKDENNFTIAIFNFTPVQYNQQKLGISRFIDYEEILNSDTFEYGGQNRLNKGIIKPRWGGVDKSLCHIQIDVPPLSVLILKPKFRLK